MEARQTILERTVHLQDIGAVYHQDYQRVLSSNLHGMVSSGMQTKPEVMHML